MPNHYEEMPDPIDSDDRRAKALVIARESSTHDRLLMEGMIAQTVSQVRHLPGAEEVLAAGIDPLDGKGPFETVQFRKNGTSIALFQHESVVYLYCTGSAAKVNSDDGENVFVEFLCQVLQSYRPRVTYAAAFSRMVRALEVSGNLYKAILTNTDLVQIGPIEIDLKSPMGKVLWSVFSMIADAERSEIVKRLFAGLVYKYLQGKYIFGAAALPPGYRLEKGKVVIDEPMVEGVRLMLEAMANDRYTAQEVMRIAGEAGVSSPTVKRLYNADATYADLSRPDSRVASLIDWLPTYATGHVEIRHANPYLGAKQFHSLPVEGASPDDAGYVRFIFDWPLPEGGWATPEVLAAAARRCTSRSSRRRGSDGEKYVRKPLSGWPRWEVGNEEHWLTGSSTNYLVMKRTIEERPPHAAVTRGGGRGGAAD